MNTIGCVTGVQQEDVSYSAIEPEQEFYGSYGWCLNAYPSIWDVAAHLENELSRHHVADNDWRRDEIARNIYLLAAAILDTADDYLLGDRYDLSKAAGKLPPLRPVFRLAQRVLNVPESFRARSLRRLLSWREKWATAVD